MEDILALYAQAYDPLEPVVCLDESFKILQAEQRQPLPLRPGKPQRYDYTYTPTGTGVLFLCTEPLRGWRHVWVTAHRTHRDWAECVKDLLDNFYPQARRVHLVMDNLNTHTPASLYRTFPPQEAQRLLSRLVFHYTPKHGSWLNMAEIEFSILSRQCLNRRIATRTELQRQIAAWETERNAFHAAVNWQFTVTDARLKLKRLYPSFQP